MSETKDITVKKIVNYAHLVVAALLLVLTFTLLPRYPNNAKTIRPLIFVFWFLVWTEYGLWNACLLARKSRFKVWSNAFRFAVIISLRATWFRTLLSYAMVAWGAIWLLPSVAGTGLLSEADVRALLTFSLGTFFTVLYSYFRIRSKIAGTTESTKETIEESVEIYLRGLNTNGTASEESDELSVFVVSRCGHFSPYLLDLLDSKRKSSLKYRRVGLLLYTVLQGPSQKGLDQRGVLYEIFGGLLRKFRYRSDQLEDTGIRLFLLPPRRKKGSDDRTCPYQYPHFTPPDYKIVCCSEIAVMAKSIFYPAIDPVAIILDTREKQTDWTFSYFRSLFAPHCSWEFDEVARADGNEGNWDWIPLAGWLVEHLHANRSWFCGENALLKNRYREYLQDMEHHARREGIPIREGSTEKFTESQERALFNCVSYLCTAGLSLCPKEDDQQAALVGKA